MHALVIEVDIEPGREDDGIAYLHSDVLPAMKQTPGLVSGYWLASAGGQGLTMLLFENENAAKATAQALDGAPRVEFATVGKVELRDVVAHL